MTEIPHCTCITCSDQGVEMAVIRSDAASALALCRGPEGDALVDVELVGPVGAGELVLVHAGTAIARLPGGAAA
jgi:hydrogenase maturation factor